MADVKATAPAQWIRDLLMMDVCIASLLMIIRKRTEACSQGDCIARTNARLDDEGARLATPDPLQPLKHDGSEIDCGQRRADTTFD